MLGIKSRVGIYIGQTSVEAVEVRSIFGRKPQIVNKGSASFQKDSPRSALIDAIGKVLLDAGIRKNKGVVVAPPSEEVMVRYFEMPRIHIQRKAVATAVKYEARKYIPFKLDEVISDFQIIEDRERTPRMKVIFVAVRQTSLSRHLDIFKQLGLRVQSVDVLFSSLMRSFLLTHEIDKKDTAVIVHIDNQRADISIVHNNIPYLCRDVSLSSGILLGAEERQSRIQGLIKEISLSLEYYKKLFAGKTISKILLCGIGELEDFAKDIAGELGLPCRIAFLGEEKRGKSGLSPGFACAYGLALKGLLRSSVEIDLIKKEKPEKARGISALYFPAIRWISVETAILAVLLLGFYINLKKPVDSLKKEIQTARDTRPSVAPFIAELPLDKIEGTIAQERRSLKELTGRMDNVPLASKFSDIVKLLPVNMWLEEFSWDEGWQKDTSSYKRNLKIEGFLFSEGFVSMDKFIDRFKSTLRNETSFFKGFDEIRVISPSIYKEIGPITITRFGINMSNGKGKEAH